MEYPQLSPSESRQMRAEALPVQDALVLSDIALPDAEMAQSFIWPDFSGHPDLSNLAHPHQNESDSENDLTWMVETINQPLSCVFYLKIEMHTPKRATFVLSFPMRERSKLVEALARSGKCCILQGPALDWWNMMNTEGMSTAKLIDLIHERNGPCLPLTMRQETLSYLRALYDEWNRQWVQTLERMQHGER